MRKILAVLALSAFASGAWAATSPSCGQIPNLACANSSQTSSQTITTNYTIGGTGGLAFSAISAPSCSAGQYFLYVDSGTSHLRKCDNGSASDIGSGAGSVSWSGITNPSGNLSLAMALNTTLFTFSGNSSTTDLFRIIDTTGNTGTGHLFEVNTAGTSTAKPVGFFVGGTSNGVEVSNAGVLAKVGTGSVQADNLVFGSDAQGDIALRGASTYARLAIGSANKVLHSNGTTAAWTSIAAADLGAGVLANVLTWTETPSGTSPNFTLANSPRTADTALIVVNGIVQTRVASCGGANEYTLNAATKALAMCVTDTSATVRAYYEM